MTATVAITHTNEKHRSRERVERLVDEALDLLGGISRFVKPGQTVLIKPNQTVYYSAEEGCTTDPLVVGALIRIVRRAGAARVQVAESSGGFFSSLECMSITGVAAVAGARRVRARCCARRGCPTGAPWSRRCAGKGS